MSKSGDEMILELAANLRGLDKTAAKKDDDKDKKDDKKEDKEDDAEEIEEAKEALEELIEKEERNEEQHVEDCACDYCIGPEMTLATAINEHLDKIAYSLGKKGNHEAAYIVEKTIKSIKSLASSKKLLQQNNED